MEAVEVRMGILLPLDDEQPEPCVVVRLGDGKTLEGTIVSVGSGMYLVYTDKADRKHVRGTA